MKRILLIDGDQFLFVATAAMEHEIRWDENNHVLQSNADSAWHNFKGMVRRIFERFDTTKHYLCFSKCNDETPNFRLLVDPEYKANRKDSRKPLCYAELRKRCEEDYRTLAFPGLEADDVMGIMATANKGAIIVSRDKDMKTIPATIWDGKDLVHVSDYVADYNHMYQTLIGDQADGYKGCPRVGPVKAEKLLKGEKSPAWTEAKGEHYDTEGLLWPRVVHAYMKANLTEADALTQARLARILRASDWDSANKTPILWSPN